MGGPPPQKGSLKPTRFSDLCSHSEGQQEQLGGCQVASFLRVWQCSAVTFLLLGNRPLSGRRIHGANFSTHSQHPPLISEAPGPEGRLEGPQADSLCSLSLSCSFCCSGLPPVDPHLPRSPATPHSKSWITSFRHTLASVPGAHGRHIGDGPGAPCLSPGAARAPRVCQARQGCEHGVLLGKHRT